MKKINPSATAKDELFAVKSKKARKTKTKKVVEKQTLFNRDEELIENIEDDFDVDLSYYRDVYDSMRDW